MQHLPLAQLLSWACPGPTARFMVARPGQAAPLAVGPGHAAPLAVGPGQAAPLAAASGPRPGCGRPRLGDI